jgi:hypothetical protein
MLEWNQNKETRRGKTFMEISKKHVGTIVELPSKPDWGFGVIGKIDLRFAYVFFEKSGDDLNKKYYLDENPLKVASSQSEPALVKRARIKNRKIKPVDVIHYPIK